MSSDRIQFVGHACFWITLDDHHFIVDANFSKKILNLVGRHDAIGIDLKNLPDFSACLVTHAHYDHLDIFSYKYFPQETPLITPPEVGGFMRRFFHNPVCELKTGEEKQVGPVKITALPVKHTGFRWSGLRYTRCNGYLLQGSQHTVFCPGDTAYGDHFKEIGRTHQVDVACLPIGPIRPRWFMKPRHLDPADALKAFEDLSAKTMIPYHWGAFRLGLDGVLEPLNELKNLIEGNPVGERVKILQPGESFPLK